MRVLDLFSGIGGFALGLESVGMRTIGFCEIEPFPRAVLAHHWPHVPIHDDVRTLSADSVSWLRAQPIDLICGGFPCQDVSVAGKGAGLSGARSGLWSEYARLVGELRPRWVLAENVGALRTRGVDRVCSDLEGEGYTVWPLLVGAWAVGAPHRRERVWIVAHSDGRGQPVERGGRLLDGEREASGNNADRRGERPVGDTECRGLQGRNQRGTRTGSEVASERCQPRWPARPGEPQHEWEEPRLAFTPVRRRDTQSLRGTSTPARDSALDADGAGGPGGEGPGSPKQQVGSAAHGLPERLARRANRESLKALGNSVVPQVVATIGQAILAAEGEA